MYIYIHVGVGWYYWMHQAAGNCQRAELDSKTSENVEQNRYLCMTYAQVCNVPPPICVLLIYVCIFGIPTS